MARKVLSPVLRAIRAAIKFILVMAVTSTPNRISVRNIGRKASLILRTAWNAMQMDARKKVVAIDRQEKKSHLRRIL
jgi:hypothetical protein